MSVTADCCLRNTRTHVTASPLAIDRVGARWSQKLKMGDSPGVLLLCRRRQHPKTFEAFPSLVVGSKLIRKFSGPAACALDLVAIQTQAACVCLDWETAIMLVLGMNCVLRTMVVSASFPVFSVHHLQFYCRDPRSQTRADIHGSPWCFNAQRCPAAAMPASMPASARMPTSARPSLSHCLGCAPVSTLVFTPAPVHPSPSCRSGRAAAATPALTSTSARPPPSFRSGRAAVATPALTPRPLAHRRPDTQDALLPLRLRRHRRPLAHCRPAAQDVPLLLRLR